MLGAGLTPRAGAPPPARYERLEIVYTVGTDQAMTERRDGEILLYDTPALADAKRLVVPLLNSRGVVRLVRLARVEPDGRESPIRVGEAVQSGSLLFWETPGVGPGDRIRFEVEQQVDANRRSGQWWFEGRIVIPLPVRHGILSLKRPIGFAGSVAIENSGHGSPAAGVDSWNLDNEKASGGTWRFTVSSFPDWKSFGAWLAGLCDTSAGNRLGSLGEPSTQEINDPLERALMLADKLSARLRVRDLDGSFRYSCRPAEETLREGWANPLEAQSVLWSLFDAQGIAAERFLLVSGEAADRSVRPEAFLGALVRVNDKDRELWFDVTKLARAPGTVDLEGGALALRISGPDVKWLSVLPNWKGLQAGRIVAHLDASVDSLGLLQANLHLSASGTPGRLYRVLLGSIGSPEDPAKLFSPFLNGLHIRSRPVTTNLDNPEHPFEVSVPFWKENVLPPFQRRTSFEFDAVPLSPTPRQLADGSLWLGPPGMYREEISVRFPSNFQTIAEVRIDDDRGFAAYHSQATVVDGELRITREVVIRQGLVAAGLRPRVWEFSRLVGTDQGRGFAVQRHGRALTEEWIRTMRPDSAGYWGSKAFDEYEYEAAVQLDEKAVQAYPKGDYTWNNLAAVLARLGRFPEAVDALEKQIELLPQSRHAYVNLALENMRTGAYEESLANFRKQLEINPENTNAIASLPKALLLVGRWWEAGKAALEASKKLNDPGFDATAAALRVCSGPAVDVQAWIAPVLATPDLRNWESIAYVLSLCGSGLEVAQDTVDRALDLFGDFTVADGEWMSGPLERESMISSFMLSEARILAWKGETEKATEMLRDIVNLGIFPEALDDLARLEWNSGRKQQALKLWRESLDIMPDLRRRIPPGAASEIESLPGSQADGVWYPLADLKAPQGLSRPADVPTYYYAVANPDGTVRSARPVERADSEAEKLIPEIRNLEFAEFRVRENQIPTVHLLKCVWQESGDVAVYHSISRVAIEVASALAPEEFPKLIAEDEP